MILRFNTKEELFKEALNLEIEMAHKFIETFTKVDAEFFKCLIDLKLEHIEQLKMFVDEK